MIDFKVENEIIIVNESSDEEINYEEMFKKINGTIEEMNSDLESLLFLKA